MNELTDISIWQIAHFIISIVIPVIIAATSTWLGFVIGELIADELNGFAEALLMAIVGIAGFTTGLTLAFWVGARIAPSL